MRIHALTFSFAYCGALLSTWGKEGEECKWFFLFSLTANSALDYGWRLNRSRLIFSGGYDKCNGSSEGERETLSFQVCWQLLILEEWLADPEKSDPGLMYILGN